MDDSKEPNESTLFTVRIWRYDANQTSLLWRGKVQDVSTGAWRYFHNWGTLIAFLQVQMEEYGAEKKNNLVTTVLETCTITPGRIPMTNENLESQKAAVRQWFAAVDNGDLETLQRLTGPAFYEQTVAMMTWVRATFSEHQLEVQELIAEENRVMARVHSKGQHTGDFFGIAGTGRRWEGNEGAMTFRFENSLITDVWQVWNIPMHLEKLGLRMTVSE